MFETATLSSGPKSKRMWATSLGVAGQAILLGWMLLAPLIWPKSLPDITRSILLAPPGPVGRPKPVETRVQPRTQTAVRATRGFTAPGSVPKQIAQIVETESPSFADPGPIGALPSDGPVGNSDIIGAVLTAGTRPIVRPPDPPAAPKPPEPAKPPRITEVRMAEPIQRVNPVYPQLAKMAHVSGKVELLGVLGTDGRIHEVKVLSGHPLLVKAAVDAVLQWVYRPTILNGKPVEVQAPITVNFILN